jgi:hypothetical protein
MFAKLIQSYMVECHSNAVAIQSTSQERSRKYFESKRRQELFEIGDLVVIKTPTRASKLAPRYKGPYKVVGIKRDIFTLEEASTKKITTRHVACIKRYLQKEPESPESQLEDEQQ